MCAEVISSLPVWSFAVTDSLALSLRKLQKKFDNFTGTGAEQAVCKVSPGCTFGRFGPARVGCDGPGHGRDIHFLCYGQCPDMDHLSCMGGEDRRANYPALFCGDDADHTFSPPLCPGSRSQPAPNPPGAGQPLYSGRQLLSSSAQHVPIPGLCKSPQSIASWFNLAGRRNSMFRMTMLARDSQRHV